MHLPLIRNGSLTILTLNDNRAPKGCLLDANLHAFFNYRGILDSHYNLMSVCSIQAKEGVPPSSISLCSSNFETCRAAELYTLPTPQQETLSACGHNITILTYTIQAKKFEAAFQRIVLRNTEFAIRIGRGTARLSADSVIKGQDSKVVKVVLLGHSPINSTDLGTTIDFQGRTRHFNLHNCNVCFQDLHMTNSGNEVGNTINAMTLIVH